MTMSLPTVISDYLAASDRGDLDALLACFSDDAVVLDEDQEWRDQAGIRQWQEKVANAFGRERDGFVFSDDGGTTAWKPNRVTKAFLRCRRGAGVRPFRLHDLRHFMATEMLHAGVPIVIVSRRLDHRRVSTTLDKYAHAVPGGDAQASATLWQILHTSS
jgi:integrase